MCGIGSIVRVGQRPIEESQIQSLVLGLEERGRDATGVVLQNEGESDHHIHKAPVAASGYLNREDTKAFFKAHLKPTTKIALVHTRLHTKGHWSKNENNHPLSSSNAAIVHNGCISNDDKLFKDLGLARTAETDSDIIRAIVDEEGFEHKTVREMCKISGSVAAACIDKRHPGQLLMVRSGNPLFVANSREYIIFASTKRTVAAAAKRWIYLNGIWSMVPQKEIFYAPFPAETAWLIGAQGKLWHQEFKTVSYTGNYYHGGNSEYQSYNSGRKKRRTRKSKVLNSGNNIRTSHVSSFGRNDSAERWLSNERQRINQQDPKVGGSATHQTTSPRMTELAPVRRGVVQMVKETTFECMGCHASNGVNPSFPDSPVRSLKCHRCSRSLVNSVEHITWVDKKEEVN